MTSAVRKMPPTMTVSDLLDWSGDGTDTRYELVSIGLDLPIAEIYWGTHLAGVGDA